MAYAMQQLQEWTNIGTKEEAATFSGRLMASNESFHAEGMTVPYWGNLRVLRTNQAEFGFEVPKVTPPVQ